MDMLHYLGDGVPIVRVFYHSVFFLFFIFATQTVYSQSATGYNFHLLAQTLSAPSLIFGVKSVSVGLNDGCAVTTTNVLKCWSKNALNGQFGGGIPVTYDSGVTYKKVSAMQDHLCFITVAGVLKCVGYNGSGQLGTGNTTGAYGDPPTVVDSGTSYSDISVGTTFSCGVTTAGVLKCWGANDQGQLGDGSGSTQLSPTVIDSGTTYSSVSTGALHACAITTSGVLKCWGDNGTGRKVGNNSTTDVTTPITIDSGTSYSAVELGTSHSCGITTAGVLKCWGLNSSRQLGDGTGTTRGTPTVINSGTAYAAVSAGAAHSCGITTAGALKCWGTNTNYRLGDGTTTQRSTPTAIDSSNVYTSVSAGETSTCGIMDANILRCWGEGPTADPGLADSATPKIVTSGTAYNVVDVGGDQSCATTSANALYCWGSNSPLTASKEAYPKIVNSGTSYSTVKIGLYQYAYFIGCGITSTGVLMCWGDNTFSNVGNGGGPQNSPGIIDSGTTYSSIDFSTGGTFGVTCGITTAGVLKCWGSGTKKQVGDGTSNDRLSPVVIDSGTSYSMISLGNEYSCAVTTTGVLKCWGENGDKQLGDGTTTDRSAPVEIDSGVNYSVVAASMGTIAHTCAITNTGTVKCWGENASGQVGDNTTTDRSTPVTVDSGNTYSKIWTGERTSCALTTGGTFRCWGRMNNKRVPTNIDSTNTYSSISVYFGTDIRYCGITTTGVLRCGEEGSSMSVVDSGVAYDSVKVGYRHTCAITTSATSNTLKCWGVNNLGQLGTASGPLTTPTSVHTGTNYGP